MMIEEARSAKAKAEARIRNVIMEFEHAAGVSVSRIELDRDSIKGEGGRILATTMIVELEVGL